MRHALLPALLLFLPHLLAAVEPAEIFSDHMVLQRDMPIPVWGKAAPGESVRVSFDTQTTQTVADTQGRWRVRLDPMPASGVSRQMTLQGGETSQPLVLRDILVGEVWLCSGQSNMYMPVGPIDYATSGVKNSATELTGANYPSIRLNCDPEHPLCGGGWKVCSPDTVKGFSAIAYFFGRALHQKLGVPVGLLNRSRGGSPIQHWTPEAAALTVPLTRKYADMYTSNRDVIEVYNRANEEYVRKLQAWGKSPTDERPAAPKELSADLMTARRFAGSGNLYKRYVEPIVPYAIRGVIWYQGEGNSLAQDVAQAYGEMLTKLITSWRNAWGQPDLPFAFVQLPRWKPGPFWSDTRQVMLETFLTVPNTGMIVIVDGDETDNLHPTDKQLPGNRLANWALSEVYHIPSPWLGPVAVNTRRQGATLLIGFKPGAGSAIVSRANLDAFELAGADGHFVPAKAELDGNEVRVSAASVPEPTVVRYAWSETTTPTLFSTDGIPASPFVLRAGKGTE